MNAAIHREAMKKIMWATRLSFRMPRRLGATLLLLCAGTGGGPARAATGAGGSARATSPDLRVIEVDASGAVGDWQALTITGPLRARVKNFGSSAGAFQVAFFDDLNGSGTLEPAEDHVYGTASIASLSPGATADVTVTVTAAPVRFRDALVFAFADSGGAVAESNETNNVSNSGVSCTFTPNAGSFEPVVEWTWDATDVVPASLNVMMTPAVIDLDGEGIPEIVFGSTAARGGGDLEIGILRAINGEDGSEVFTVTDPSLLIDVASSVAAGDLDGDGRPEIIATAANGTQLLAFHGDGTFLWRSDTIELVNWGSPSIADLNADGTPEIVIGRQALNARGHLLWTGTGGHASQRIGTGPLSLVADLDLDGTPEILAGNTAYRANGTIDWQQPLRDGYPAVANFDADPYPEIVHVTDGDVRLLNHDGTVVWGPIVIPGGGEGGPPTIADFDGDGQPEIGVAGAVRYVVFEGDGSIKWTSVTQDSSSNVTGSSVFDFDGDGSAEVVYRDELYMRIYRGIDGTILYQVPMSSCTWFEYPVVADVDADGNAEIVAVANQNCGFGDQQGVTVVGDANDNWVSTRPLWNQHTYHITNINDDGTIPTVEPNNWLTPPGKPYNNYRQNLLTNDLPSTSAPDLTSAFIACASSSAGAWLTARIGNAGSVIAGAGIPVSFYRGDPRTGGTLLGTVHTTRGLPPGAYEEVALPVPPDFDFSAPVFVVADDAGGLSGTQNECDEDNNIHGSAGCDAEVVLVVSKVPQPATVTEPGGEVTFTATATNTQPFPIRVDSVVDDVFGNVGHDCVPPLPAVLDQGGTLTCTFTHRVHGQGGDVHRDTVTISGTDPEGTPVGGTGSAEVPIREAGDNQPPVALCRDLDLPADASCRACGSVDAGSYDPDGPPWTITENPGCSHMVGETTVTLTITDPDGLSDTCAGTVTVFDEIPPVVRVRDLQLLWPPNHKYRQFRLSDCATLVSDNCGLTSDINGAGRIRAIWSDEPENVNGKGDGDTMKDIVITGPSSFKLRSERQGTNNGRVYSVSFEVSDLPGNTTSAVCRFGVYHDQSGRLPVDDGPGSGYTVTAP